MTGPDDRGGPSDEHVVLLGMMGAGKTTVARALGERLGWPVRDNDRDLEEHTGRSGAEIAASDGVEALHAIEARLLLEALETGQPTVIAAAASVVDAADCCGALSDRATVVWLDAPADALAARRASGSHRRPLEVVAASVLDGQRRARLDELADLRLDARNTPADLVAAVLDHLGRRAV